MVTRGTTRQSFESYSQGEIKHAVYIANLPIRSKDILRMQFRQKVWPSGHGNISSSTSSSS